MGQSSSRPSLTVSPTATSSQTCSSEKTDENLFYGIYIPPESEYIKTTGTIFFFPNVKSVNV